MRIVIFSCKTNFFLNFNSSLLTFATVISPYFARILKNLIYRIFLQFFKYILGFGKNYLRIFEIFVEQSSIVSYRATGFLFSNIFTHFQGILGVVFNTVSV